MATARISLDNPVLAGRLRTFSRRTVVYERRVTRQTHSRLVQDVRAPLSNTKTQKASPKKQQPYLLASGTKIRSIVKPHPRIEKSSVLRRGGVHMPVRKHKRHVRLSPRKMLVSLAVLLFLFGVGVGIDGLRANKLVVAQVQNIQQSSSLEDSSNAPVNNTGSEGGNVASASIPAEDDKPDIGAYKVAADLPRALYIPKIDVEARVLHLGVTQEGAIAAPSNILDAGWYKESAKPGKSGAVLIDGHVHGPTKPGIFQNLKKLKPGDQIQLERGDGTHLTYEVVESKTYPADNVDMGAALRSARVGKQGLNLITCGGELDKSTNHYKDRLVVFATQK